MKTMAALVLAAGESSRMGRDKALLEYRGKTFLEAILSNLREAGINEIAVVLGHHASDIERGANLTGARVVINAEYKRGQASSFQAGLHVLADVDGVLLCLVDHPAAGPDVMRTLVARFFETGAPVVIPVYHGRRGHPVIIGSALFEALMSLASGDGADTVVRKYRDVTEWLDVEDAGVALDIDEPEDLRALQAES